MGIELSYISPTMTSLAVALVTGSGWRGIDQDIEAGSFGERLKIVIASEEGNRSIHAALSDQGIAEGALRRLASTLGWSSPALCQ